MKWIFSVHYKKYALLLLLFLLFSFTSCNLLMDLISPKEKPRVEIKNAVDTIEVGEQVQLRALYFENGQSSDVTAQVIWSSTDSHVLSVSAFGEVTGLKTGTADIIADYSNLTDLATMSAASPSSTPPPPVDPWFTFFGGGDVDKAGAVVATGDGGLIVCGFSASNIDYPGISRLNNHSGSGYDVLLAKFDAGGTCEWFTFFGEVAIDPQSANVIQTSDGGYVFTGLSGLDMLLVKFSATGSKAWHTVTGGDGQDMIYSVVEKSDGKLVVTGVSTSASGFSFPVLQAPHGAHDIFVAEFGSDGSVGGWITFIGTPAEEYAKDITRDESDNLYIVGHGQASFGSPPVSFCAGSDIVVVKLSPDGTTMLWNAFLGGFTTDYGQSILLADGKLYVSGKSDGALKAEFGTPENPISGSLTYDLILAQLNVADGTVNWHTYLGSTDNEAFGYLARTNDGNILLAGDSPAALGDAVKSYTPTEINFLAAEYGPAGNKIWHTFFGDSSGACNLIGITAVQDGGIILLGNTTASFGTPILTHASPSIKDLLLVRLDGDGNGPH